MGVIFLTLKRIDMFQKLIIVSAVAYASAFSFRETQGIIARQSSCIAGVSVASTLSLPPPIGGIVAGICYDYSTEYTKLAGDKDQYNRLNRIIKSGIPQVELSTIADSDVVQFVEQARLDADPVSSIKQEISKIVRDESEVVLKQLVSGVFQEMDKLGLSNEGLDDEKVDLMIEVLKLL